MAKRPPTEPLEEEDQNSKMSPISLTSRSQVPEAIIQKGPLFALVNYTSLLQIVNHLDPRSFVRFARTCKELHDICYKDKGIQVKFPCIITARYSRLQIYKAPCVRMHNRRRNRQETMSEQTLQKIQKMPFIFVVEYISFSPIDARLLEQVRQLLRRFARVIVEMVSIIVGEDWNDVVQFLQEYNVKRVYTRTVIPEDFLPFFLTKLDHFDYYKPIPDYLIASATVKKLFLYGGTISKYTFMELLRKFANGDIVDCYIERSEPDPFIEACSEVMKVVKMEEIDWNMMEPSVLYNKPSDPSIFYLRKSDGSIGKLSIDKVFVHFRPGMLI